MLDPKLTAGTKTSCYVLGCPAPPLPEHVDVRDGDVVVHIWICRQHCEYIGPLLAESFKRPVKAEYNDGSEPLIIFPARIMN